MEKLKIIYKKDLLGNKYPYGIRDEGGFLFFFRKVIQYPNQGIRYEKELFKMMFLAEKLLTAMRNF